MKFLAILNLIISIQAFFLCFHFSVKTKGLKVLNRVLAILCLSFAIISLNTFFDLDGILPPDTLFQELANHIMWFTGPLLFFYVVYNDREPNRRFIYWNTIPYFFPIIITGVSDWPVFTQIIPFIAFIQISIYLYLSIKYSVKNYARARQYYNWILPAILVFTIVLSLNFCLSVLKIWGIEIFSNSIQQGFTSLFVIPIFYLAYQEMNSTHHLGIQPDKYLTTNLSKKKTTQYLAKIEKAMKEDKFFQQPKVTLSSFSQHIDINPKYISQVINHNLKMSFSDYILAYRLEDVKSRLADPDNQHLTIYGIAQESGFGSNSRFNFLFKKHTGLTPKAFQEQYLG